MTIHLGLFADFRVCPRYTETSAALELIVDCIISSWNKFTTWTGQGTELASNIHTFLSAHYSPGLVAQIGKYIER